MYAKRLNAQIARLFHVVDDTDAALMHKAKFYVINTNEYKAHYSSDERAIKLSKGLIERISEDSVFLILAHEVRHYLLRAYSAHHISSYVTIREEEFEADRWATYSGMKAGIDNLTEWKNIAEMFAREHFPDADNVLEEAHRHFYAHREFYWDMQDIEFVEALYGNSHPTWLDRYYRIQTQVYNSRNIL